MKLFFPMKYLNITQGVGDAPTHMGTNAIDCAGKDTGMDDLYAPCSMICKFKDISRNGNACFFESTEPVELANGMTTYVTMLFIHDNDVSNIYAGKKFAQGEVFYQEGTAGKATGNHVHIEVAAGRYANVTMGANALPYAKNKHGVYSLPKTMHPALAFFLKDVTVINDYGYKWKNVNDSSRWKAFPNGIWKYFKLVGRYAKNEWIFDKEYNGWYYFDENESMVRDTFVKHDGKWTYIQKDGKMFKGGNITFKADNSGYLTRL